VRIVRGGYVQDWLSRPTDYNWRVDPEVSGRSRAVADIGTHWFDTAEFVIGQRVASVNADLATFIRTRSRPLAGSVAFATGDGPAEPVAVDSEDAAAILLRFAGGARGSCVVSQVSTGHKNAFSLAVDGGVRSLSWEQERPEELWIWDRGEARRLVRDPAGAQPGAGVPWLPAGHPEGWGEALRDLLRPFYAAVADRVPPTIEDAPYPTFRDGARSVAFVDAVLESAASGGWVDMPTP
jgi:predicted dehydrogenase